MGDPVAKWEPLVLGAPFPCERLGPSVRTELDPGALPLAGDRPHQPLHGYVVVAIEPVVLERPREVAARLVVHAHDAQRVERVSIDQRPFVLDEEELSGMPSADVGADPRLGCALGIALGLVRAPVRLALRAPVAEEDGEGIVLVPARRRGLVFRLHERGWSRMETPGERGRTTSHQPRPTNW